MKNIYIKIVAIVVMTLFVSCCNTKKEFITSFEKFISITESNYTDYNSATWDKVNAEFKELSEVEFNKFKGKLTDEEKTKIGKLKGRYYLVLAKYKALELQRRGKGIYDQIEGFIEGLTK